VDRLSRDRSRRAEDARRLARGWARVASEGARAEPGAADMSAGALIALAYPDRVAKARGKPGEFLMANGRAAILEPHERLAREPFLAVAEIAGRAAAARILAAAPLTLEEIESAAGDALQTREETTFDRAAAALRTRRVRRIGALTLAERVLPTPPGPATAVLLAEGVAALGLNRLPWTKALSQWRDRVMFLRRAEGEEWPDLSDAALTATIGDWLAPYLDGKTALADIGADDLGEALRALLPWDMTRRLDAEAPTHFAAPTGNAIALDYEAEGGPRHPRAGTVRPVHPSGHRRRARAADPASPVAGPSADPDHPRFAGFLERLMERRENGNEGSLSPPRLAGRPRRRGADSPREAAGNLSGQTSTTKWPVPVVASASAWARASSASG
jgi:ATP-dependent helicase HrpB